MRQGKLKSLKILQKYPEFMATFVLLGNSSHDSSNLRSDLEKFVCAMYGKKTCSNINKVRYELFKMKFHPKSGGTLSTRDGAELSLLPPCM